MIHFDDTEFDDLSDYYYGLISVEEIVYGFMMTRIQWQIIPPRVLDVCPRDSAQGVTLQGGYYTARRFVIEGIVRAASAPDMLTKLGSLETLFTVGTVKPLVIEYLNDPEAEIPRTYQALPVAFGQRSGRWTPTLTPWSVTFQAPDPVAEGETIELEYMTNPNEWHFPWDP